MRLPHRQTVHADFPLSPLLWFVCIATHLFVRQDSRIRVAPLTACSALRAIPSLRSALCAFGRYVLITSRFICDSCSLHHDSSAKLVLACQTLFLRLRQRTPAGTARQRHSFLSRVVQFEKSTSHIAPNRPLCFNAIREVDFPYCIKA